MKSHREILIQLFDEAGLDWLNPKSGNLVCEGVVFVFHATGALKEISGFAEAGDDEDY